MVDDNIEYARVTVQLHGRGIIARDRVGGQAIKMKQQQTIAANDLLVAEIDAMVGGFGIVPDNLSGAIVSSHYFTFEINVEQLLPEFAGLLCRIGYLTEQVLEFVRGSLNYAAIRPRHVEAIAIPWAPIPVQRSICERVALADRALEANRVQAHALETLPNAILRAAMENGE